MPNNHILPRFGHLRLDEITREKMQELSKRKSKCVGSEKAALEVKAIIPCD